MGGGDRVGGENRVRGGDRAGCVGGRIEVEEASSTTEGAVRISLQSDRVSSRYDEHCFIWTWFLSHC